MSWLMHGCGPRGKEINGRAENVQGLQNFAFLRQRWKHINYNYIQYINFTVIFSVPNVVAYI